MRKTPVMFMLTVALIISSAKHSYKDVPKNYRFDENLHELVKYSVLDRGVKFRPKEHATRGEVADFIVRSITKGSIFANQPIEF